MIYWFDFCVVCRMFLLSFCCGFVYFFFFKQKTAYEMRISDWSSDVCSSDLAREAVHRRPDLGRGVERVGAGALQYLQRDRGFAVEQRTQRIIIGAYFDPGDLTEPGELAVGTSLDDNRSKFFLGRKAALHVERDLLRGGGVRLPPDAARGDFDILRADRGDDIARGQPARSDPRRVEPDAHRIFTGTPHDHVEIGRAHV